jgi:hypothetical protein
LGYPIGLVIDTEAANLMKKFKGSLFVENLRSSSHAYISRKHANYTERMCANPDVTKYLGTFHTYIWSRSEFNEICKVDYVDINLAT